MEDLELIKTKKLDLRKLYVELDQLTNERKRNKLLKNINALKYEHETEIMNYLELNDAKYKEILNENFDLLVNNNIIFKVTQEGGDPFSSYEKELIGGIHSNGYLYLTTNRTNNIFIPFQQHLYPISYKGLINYLGETNVSVSKTQFKIFGSRVPQKFEGSINTNGEISFETIDSFIETGGNSYVNNIIADPFSGDNLKRERFIDNKFELKNKITEFREQI